MQGVLTPDTAQAVSEPVCACPVSNTRAEFWLAVSSTWLRLSALQGLMSSLDDEQAAALARALELILSRREEIASYRPAEKAERS